MADDRTLLVVDDEEVVCQACRRIFSRQGFQVEVNTDARQGLALATEKDFTDHSVGHQDAQHRRNRIPGKAAREEARRSSANHYRLSQHPQCFRGDAPRRLRLRYQAVHVRRDHLGRATGAEHEADDRRPVPSVRGGWRSIVSRNGPVLAPLFWDESWVRMEVDGSACVGAVLPGSSRGVDHGGRLPRIGEVVYQGLPLAGVTTSAKPEPDRSLARLRRGRGGERYDVGQRPELLATDPCGEGRLACICTTRHDEVGNCKPRRILLVNAEASAASEQARKLSAIGCQVEQVADRDALLAALAGDDGRAVFLDARSLGNSGPALVEQVNRRAPHSRVVIMGAGQRRRNRLSKAEDILLCR